jgi:hypothetical protein
MSMASHGAMIASLSAIMSSAESRLREISCGARVFSNELFSARGVIKDLESQLQLRMQSLPDAMRVERRDLQRKIEFVRNAFDAIQSGEMIRRIDRSISATCIGMGEVFSTSHSAEDDRDSFRKITPLPHEKRTDILSVSIAKQNPVDASASSRDDEPTNNAATLSLLVSPSRGISEKAQSDRLVQDLGIALGVQRRDVCALEGDACACGAPMLRSVKESLMVCSSADCGRVKRIIETTASGPGVDDMDVGIGNTRRSTSIRDFIHKWQAKETATISTSALSSIAKFIYNDIGIKQASDITYRAVVCAVFELKLGRELFDHISQIWSMLTGMKPPTLTFNENQLINAIWRIIQEKFSSVSSNHSKCFFFPLIIERFVRLMNFDNVADFLVPVYTKPSDSVTYNAVQGILDSMGYRKIPPPHIYFVGDIQSATVRRNIPQSRTINTRGVSLAKLREAPAPAPDAGAAPHKRPRTDEEHQVET